MPTAKTVIKKASRRRGTVSLTEVRKVVGRVLANYKATKAAKAQKRVKAGKSLAKSRVSLGR